jgi:hypothetical protein
VKHGRRRAARAPELPKDSRPLHAPPTVRP